MIEIQKAGDLKQEDFVTITLFGDTGTGKTTAAAKLPNVLIIQTEPNGLRSIIAANPDAKIIRPEDAEELEEAFSLVRSTLAIAKENGQDAPWDWVVLDSFTDAQDLIIKRILKATGSGKQQPTLQEWGMIADASQNFAKQFRDLPINKVIICLQDTAIIDSGGDKDARFFVPQLRGRKLPNKLASMSNIVGCCYRSTENGNYRILLRGGSNFMVKGHPNLNSVETPRIAEWVERMDKPVDQSAYREYVGESEEEDVIPDTESDESNEDEQKNEKPKPKK